MARGVIAERTRLSWFVMGRGLRTAGGRLNAHPLLRWRFAGGASDRLLIAPQDLRTADPTRASEIYAGRFAFAGKVVTCDGRLPFEVMPPSVEWAEELHGFGWLRHLRAAESNITRSGARSLVEGWIARPGPRGGVAWRPEVVARRIISWLMHAPFILADSDVRFYRRFLRSLTRQVRFLRRTARSVHDGVPRLQALMALAFAGLCLGAQQRLTKPVGRRLSDELQRQILPDGGHISRNPRALIELLLDLLPLRQAYGARNLPAPPALVNAVERMMPMLRFFRHSDGGFASFNGMGPTPPDLLATVFAYDDARGKPVANAAHSGYQRLEAGGAVILADTGSPPPLGVSEEAHAGCLSFELSARRQRIVVNCGLPAVGRDSWRHLARRTQAHTTVSFADASSCQFLRSARLQRFVGTPVVQGPNHVAVDRSEDFDRLRLTASHDGYASRFGIVHERTLYFAQHGRRLDGEDTILPARGDHLPRRGTDHFAVRFHLHPSVRVQPAAQRNSAVLTLPSRDVWTFDAYESPITIEESVYLAGPHGPMRTNQIVIYAHARETPRIPWSFVLAEPGDGAPLRAGTEEPQLPL
jgi:uncharacterized heparinase superfamily protein